MLADWESFYLLVGSAAAALIGLLFIVATLTINVDRSSAERGNNFYMTPIVFHLGVIVVLSAMALAPVLTHDRVRHRLRARGPGRRRLRRLCLPRHFQRSRGSRPALDRQILLQRRTHAGLCRAGHRRGRVPEEPPLGRGRAPRRWPWSSCSSASATPGISSLIWRPSRPGPSRRRRLRAPVT